MSEIYQPTLVIGLGGTGKNIILALKKMIAENSQNGIKDFPFLEMISFDTDHRIDTQKSLIETINAEELSLNKNQEVFQLQGNFGTVPDFNDYPEIKEWFPESLKARIIPQELSIGASQMKPVGRFTFAWNANEIYEKVYKFLKAPVDAVETKNLNVSKNLSKTINVFICGSVCGGTGAGTFLDMAYLVRYISSIVDGNGYQIRLFGMLALASLFDGNKCSSSVRQNCYASLLELDHFMNDINYENPLRSFTPAYKHFNRDYSKAGLFKAFDYPFLFDNAGGGISLGSPVVFSEMVARFIYLLTAHDLSNHWFSMQSNINKEKDPVVNKSTEYNGMGTYSVLYPKRTIIQLCAYNLSMEYFNKILDDSYAPQEIDNLVKRFLNDIRMNPTTDQLENEFDVFNEPDGFTGSFTEYIESQITDMEDQDFTKSEIAKGLSDWKKDIDKKVIEFRKLNSDRAAKLREKFLAKLNLQLESILDLHEHSLGVKKDSNGNELPDRGSLIRAEKFIESLIDLFNKASDKYRKKLNESEALFKNLEGDFETALTELEDKADGFFAIKKKLDDARNNVLNVCRDLYSAKKHYLVCGWIRQLFTDILWNEVPKYPGLLKELDKYRDKYIKIHDVFNDLQEIFVKHLNDNKHLQTSPFFDVVFNYEKDVIQSYKELVEEKKEDFIFGEISNQLMAEDKFGKTYLNALARTKELIKVDILKVTEQFFKDKINKKSIEDRILEEKDICKKLESGKYFDLAEVYLGVDYSVLSSINRDFKNAEVFSISIPDDYEGKPCKHIKGDEGRGKRCPVEENPENYTGALECKKFGKCLKQKLLMSRNGTVAITPTHEISEINVIHTIAGYPLRAVSSVMNNCKPVYVEEKKKQREKNERMERNCEEINMFGSLDFDDLNAPSIDPRTKVEKNKFKKYIFVAAITKRLIIQRLSVDFVTERDWHDNRKDNPSLHLGKSIKDMLKLHESARIDDKQKINQFMTDVNHLIESSLSNNEEGKTRFASMATEFYETCRVSMPDGLGVEDLDLLNDVVKDICGVELKPAKDITGPLF